MQQGGPSSPSCSSPLGLPLRVLSSAPCRSDSAAPARRKHKVRPDSTTSDFSRMRSILSFYLCLLLCLSLGLACVVFVCLWSSQWRGSFSWDGSGLEFNWHPVLMTTGLVVMYGYGAVVYRIPLTWGENKLPWKLLHAAFMLLALLLSVIGLCAVFDFHNAKSIPNLYSLHSWIGISATILFAFQWVAGFAGFLLPCSPVSLRKLFKPVHVWLGGSIVTLSIAACISGINEKLFFVLKGDNQTQPYSKLPPEALLANSLGLLIVAFGLVVLRILSNRNWQRPDPRLEETTYSPLNQEEND